MRETVGMYVSVCVCLCVCVSVCMRVSMCERHKSSVCVCVREECVCVGGLLCLFVCVRK